MFSATTCSWHKSVLFMFIPESKPDTYTPYCKCSTCITKYPGFIHIKDVKFKLWFLIIKGRLNFSFQYTYGCIDDGLLFIMGHVPSHFEEHKHRPKE